jgi:transcriptional regulator with XRE-family HTH domain
METKTTNQFRFMLATVLRESECSQKTFAEGIGITPQFFHDIFHGRRGPSPSLINKIFDYMGRGPKGRKEWHTAGAKAVGWEI